MVLESIIGAKSAENHPLRVFICGIIFTFVAAAASYFIFKSYISLLMITFSTIASIPLIHKTIRLEAGKDLKIYSEVRLLREHGKAIRAFIMLFLGFLAAFSFLFVALKENTKIGVFEVQLKTIAEMNPELSADISSLEGILANNLKVLLFVILFSFFYSAGAIFILSWNASVIGAAIGTFITNKLGSGLGTAISLGVARYMTHGIFEIWAYFVAALAGGIISVAVINHHFKHEKFARAMFDAISLILISILLIILAALIEIYITSALF